MAKTLVIADPGSTHGGSLDLALSLVHASALAGADAVKFQWTSDPIRLATRRHVSPDNYRAIAFSADWLPVLAGCADERQVEFMCTTYLPEDVETVAPWVTRFKIASFEAMDVRHLAAHLNCKKDILVSTGMMDERDLLASLRRRRMWPALKLLHCVSAYPAPVAEANLAVIRRNDLDGFSDHTRSTWTGALAVAAGARIVEAHIALDDEHAGPDRWHSFLPDDFARYVENIRQAEAALGDGIKRCTDAERPMEVHRVDAPVRDAR